MDTVLLLATYTLILVVPGLAISNLLGIRLDRFLSSVAISYSIFAVSFITANHFGISARTFAYWIAIVVITSSSYLIAVNYQSKGISIGTSATRTYFTPTLIITSLSFLYQIVVGSFTEVPADLYAHLERYQAARLYMQKNMLGISLDWHRLLTQGSGVFYYLLAFSNSISDLNGSQLTSVIDFANRTFFLLASYFFTREIFNHSEHNRLVAAVATFFVMMHFGTLIFAFTRYYSLAPTMLNLIIYMFGVLLIRRIFNRDFSKVTIIYYLLLAIMVVAAAAIHVQEAMFIIVIGTCMCLVLASLNLSDFSKHSASPAKVFNLQIWLILTICLASFIAAYMYSQHNFPRAPNAHWRLWEFGEAFWFFPKITTLNLKLQFSQVVTLWGMLVYLLFFINIKRYRNNIFVLAAMLSPVVTILNPFFVDLFLRHYNSTTLWRLCYLLPIHLVGADLFVFYLRKTYQKKNVVKITSALISFLMLALLLPAFNTWNGTHYSRLPSLMSSDPELGSSAYSGLLNFLDALPQKRQIITDPMTGYMVSGMTKHHSNRRKFFRDHTFIHFSFNNYDGNPLDKYSKHLIIVNQRPNTESKIGELSGHWRKNEWLETRNYYPPQLLSHLNQRSERFTKIWEQSDVSIYEIQ